MLGFALVFGLSAIQSSAASIPKAEKDTTLILVDKKTQALAVNWDDELVKATALTRDGAVIHPNFQPKTAA